jgi:hypothetical protein
MASLLLSSTSTVNVPVISQFAPTVESAVISLVTVTVCPRAITKSSSADAVQPDHEPPVIGPQLKSPVDVHVSAAARMERDDTRRHRKRI